MRVGLKPGALSRNRQWRPPFISFSRDPAYALGSAHAYDDIREDMDLWQIDLEGRELENLSGPLHDELRIYVRIPFRELTYIATRKFDEEN